VDALHPVFWMAAGVSALGFVLSLLIPDRKLRDTVQAAGPQEHFAMPRADDRAGEIERALSVLAKRDTRRQFYEQLLAELGIDLSPLQAWTLARVEDGVPGPAESLALRLQVDPARVSAALDELQQSELVVREDGWYSATPAGRELIERVVQARRERLAARLADWSPEQHEELALVLHRLARDLLTEPPAVPPRTRAGTAAPSPPYSSHPYSWINAAGDRLWVKYAVKTVGVDLDREPARVTDERAPGWRNPPSCTDLTRHRRRIAGTNPRATSSSRSTNSRELESSPATGPRGGFARWRRLVIVCLVVAALLLIAFWVAWWADRRLVASRSSPSYYQFEEAFALADAWLLITVVAAALALWRRRPSALVWLLAAGGAGLYLLGMDLLYDLRHGIYTSGRGGAIELGINILTACASIGVLWWSWRNRLSIMADSAR
jgi:DNA-binding MarR family transcriptional regulator